MPRTSWGTQQAPVSLLPECGRCGLYKKCNSPIMPLNGEGRRRVLIVGEAPGKDEDAQNKPFVGATGFKLLEMLKSISVNMRKDCWLYNALICRPTDARGWNRIPEKEEIEWCQPNLIRTIGELKPDVIIPLGYVATRSVISYAWKPGEVDEIEPWVGWQIPCQKLNCWICPSYHPAFLLHQKSCVAEMQLMRHLTEAFQLEGVPWPDGPPNYDQFVQILTDPDEVERVIQGYIESERPVAFDYENNPLKPDVSWSEVLCVGISDGRTAYAFPWEQRNKEALSKLLRSRVPKIAANLIHEDRWSRKKLRHGVCNWLWDTVLGAHWLDCRRYISGLKFQSFVLLGAPDYSSQLDAYIEGKEKGGNSPNRLKEVEPRVLMKYCGMDALLEVLVAQIQMGEEWTWGF